MKKFVFFAVLALTLGLCSYAKAGTLMDVPEGHWAADAVQRLVDMGLIEGYPDGTFGGNRPMTRYEYAMVVDRLMKYIEKTYCTKDGCKPGQVQAPVAGGPDINVDVLAKASDLAEVQAIVKKLSAEFKDEIAALNARVDGVEKKQSALEEKVNGLVGAKTKISGYIRQRVDVLDSDLNAGTFRNFADGMYYGGALNAAGTNVSLNAGYEMLPGLIFEDNTPEDNVYYLINLEKILTNQVQPYDNAGGNSLDIVSAYVALDFSKNVRELDALKLTSGYQPVEFGPYGALVDNRGLKSTLGVRLDAGKDIVSITGFGGLTSLGTRTLSGLGSDAKDPYVAARLNLDLPFATVGVNYLPNGYLQEKAWGVDLSANLLKGSPFLKALKAEYFQVTDLANGTSPAATAQDDSYIVGLDVYKTKRAGLSVSYADLPAVVAFSGVDANPYSEYDIAAPCAAGTDVNPGSCWNYESGNIMFPAGFKGLGVQASYIVLGDVELGAKAIFGDFAGGTVPATLNGNLAGKSLKGITYPGYGSVSVAKPINKTSKFRVEYFQQGKDPILLNRVRGELLINF